VGVDRLASVGRLSHRILAPVFTSALQMALIYVPPLASFLGTEWLDLEQLGLCLGFSLLWFVYLEAVKLLTLLARKRRAHL
jgi:Ca2+-transporting ATPase